MNFNAKLEHALMHIKYKTKYLDSELRKGSFNELIASNINVDIDLVTIAYENPNVILSQIRLIKKYLIDSYSFIVADNSVDDKKANMIEKKCKENDIQYIRLPPNPYNGKYSMGSYSNGAAMNYVYKKYIKKRNTKYFGFLDHDIFPYRQYSITAKLNNQLFWGTLRCVPTKNAYCSLYPWAGFCFFNNDAFRNKKMNFLPKKGYGDTGAASYLDCFLPIISTDSFLEYNFANLRRVHIQGISGSPQSSQYEIIDSAWIHYINASNWSSDNIELKEKKMSEIVAHYAGNE